jgi:peptidoglycan/xylan/chitin deacetylase (PgdA/CDA1 family)
MEDFYKMLKPLTFFLLIGSVIMSCSKRQENLHDTEITKWQDNKTAAISITFDDATINQFHQALPILDTLGFKGTFFINTADIPGSKFPPKYFGRPLDQIVKETATIPTSQDNLFERASALRFLPLENAIASHNSAGSLYETGKSAEAWKVVDDAFALARKRKSIREVTPVLLSGELITWNEIKQFAARGHEFGSHTISHPRLAVLDEPNLLYELEKCKEEILYQLGPEHTFSAECPFGTEDERVMEYAYKIHPALRNRMPEPFLKELNRASTEMPGNSSKEKEYVQWQRGPLQKTTVELMKSYVDTILVHDNVWLVLTFHGIDGVGWEAKPHAELKDYFSYIKKYEDKLWVASFGDVTKYMRERMYASVKVDKQPDKVMVSLTHSLDQNLYNLPLTMKTYIDDGWKEVSVIQGDREASVKSQTDSKGTYILYSILPNGESAEITGR